MTSAAPAGPSPAPAWPGTPATTCSTCRCSPWARSASSPSSGHVVTPELRALLDAHLSGDVQKATEIHQKLLPVFTGMFRTQGVMTTKAALALQGLPAGPLRAPMVELSPRRPPSSRSILPPAG